MTYGVRETAKRMGGDDATYAGIVSAVVAAFFFVGQDAGVKWLTAELVVLEILFLRSVFGIGYCLLYFGWQRSFADLWVAQPWLMMIRCFINFLAWCCFFTALKYKPLADVLALFFLFPLLITALSVPLLGERVGIRRWLAVLAGFAGVLVMLNPTNGIDWYSLLVIGAALSWSVVAIMTRKLAQTETPMATLFYTLSTFVALGFAPQFLIWETPSGETWGLLAVISLLGVLAQFFIIKAYSMAAPSTVAPFEYTALIWAVFVGYALWGDIPGIEAAIGGTIIVLSGLYIIHREARRRVP